MTAVELTVSMAVHDARDHVGRAIASVLAETDVALELIVVDDGSTDGTPDVVVASADPRVRLLFAGGHRGAAACEALAARESVAPLIVHLSAQDIVVPGALRRMVAAARNAPEAGLVHGYAIDAGEDGRVTRDAFRAQRRRRVAAPGLGDVRMYRRDVLAEAGTAVRVPNVVVVRRARLAPPGVRAGVRAAGTELRRSARRAATRIARRLVERAYEAAVPRLARWPLAGAAAVPPATRRVAYYTWRFPTLSETFIHRELAALERAGVDVVIVAESGHDVATVDRDGAALRAKTTYLAGVPRREIRRHHRGFFARRPLRYAGLFLYVLSRRYGPLKTPGEDLAVFSRCVLVAGVLDGRVEHLHAPWADRSAFVVSVAARLLGVTYSFHARAHDVHRTTYRVGLADRVASAEFVVTNTRYNVEHLQALVPDLGSRLALIHNGVEPARFPPRDPRPDGPLRLLCVARLIEQKGIDDLLRACRLLVDRGHDVVCDVIGGAETPLYTSYAIALRQLHQSLGLGDRVRFLGARPLAEVMSAYARADVFVLPCVIAADGSRDITPNALIEAMAMRLPVVSTTVTGVPEIVEHGVSGLLVPPSDPEALAGAIARIARDPALGAALGEAARRRVEERFDVDRNMAVLARLFSARAGRTGSL